MSKRKVDLYVEGKRIGTWPIDGSAGSWTHVIVDYTAMGKTVEVRPAKNNEILAKIKKFFTYPKA